MLIRIPLLTQDHTKDDTTHNKKDEEETCEPNHTSLSVRTITHVVKPRAEED